MQTFKKMFLVDNALIVYELWEEHQTMNWKEMFGWGAPPAIFDVTGGVANVYYQDEVFAGFAKIMQKKRDEDSRFFYKMMDWYEEKLAPLQALVQSGKLLTSTKEIQKLYEDFKEAWVGLDISYSTDYIDSVTDEKSRSAEAREKAFGFYIGSDRLIRNSLKQMFPDFGDLASHLSFEEVVKNTIPARAILEKRSEHYIFYKGKIITDVSFEEFCKKENITIEPLHAGLRKHIAGQSAMGGVVKGVVKVLRNGEDAAQIKKGVILVVKNDSPQLIKMLETAAGAVLDAGGYYHSGAIAARALKKPFIYNTQVATIALHDGDMVEVDGGEGVVRVIKK